MVSTRSIAPAFALVPLFSLLMTVGCGDSSSPNSHDANKLDTGGLVGQDASGGSKTDALASGGQSGGGAGGSGGGATGGSSVVDAAGGTGGSTAEVGSDVQAMDAPTSDGPLPDGPILTRDTADAHVDAAVDGPIDSPIADLGSDTRPDVGTIPSPDTRLDTTRFDTPGADASTPCVNGQACTLAAGGSGLCRSNACVACVDPTDDNACVTTYGATHICSAGQCVAGSCHNSTGCTNGKICGTNHLCGNCASDTACRADSAYGTSRICLNTSCVVGNCHDRTSDCTNGRICDTTNHTCSACTNTSQCTPAGAYGAGYICSPGGACVQGNCQNSQDCPTGSICGVSTALTCGPCTIDSQCKNDARYGAAYMCRTAAGANQGTCFSNSCAGSAAGSVCSTNPADVCCNSACVAGNCCQDSDCAGSNRVCVNNTCTSCAAVTGNQYFVNPGNGSDTAATGSGKTGGGNTDGNCSFKTVTHALSVVGTSAPAGTTITIIGSATATLANPTNMVGEASTIQVPTNVEDHNLGRSVAARPWCGGRRVPTRRCGCEPGAR